MKLKTLKDIRNLKNKRVLVRVGLDCPIKNGRVVDDTRIRAVLPTIRYLAKKKAKVILISHLGRPQGRKIKRYSLKPVFNNLETKFPSGISDLKFVNDCLGKQVNLVITKLKPGDVVLLENLRFYSEEEKNDLKFAKRLANLADLYVNEAFSNCHRQHASMSAITKYLPSYAGLILEKEIKALSLALRVPRSSCLVIMGGRKISTKIKPIKRFIKIAGQILIGGALASNFFKAAGYQIGKSFYEPKMIKIAQQLSKNKKIILPFDVKIKARKRALIFNVGELNNLGKNFEILDIGPKTVKLFQKFIKSAKIIVWNGPMGYFEDKRFSSGTKLITQAIFANKKAQIIIGGGETIAALKKFKVYPVKSDEVGAEQFNRVNSLRFKVRNKNRVFVSTGGGAMLEFLSGKTLSGIKPLIIKNK